jgi:hypothetical protein
MLLVDKFGSKICRKQKNLIKHVLLRQRYRDATHDQLSLGASPEHQIRMQTRTSLTKASEPRSPKTAMATHSIRASGARRQSSDGTRQARTPGGSGVQQGARSCDRATAAQQQIKKSARYSLYEPGQFIGENAPRSGTADAAAGGANIVTRKTHVPPHASGGTSPRRVPHHARELHSGGRNPNAQRRGARRGGSPLGRARGGVGGSGGDTIVPRAAVPPRGLITVDERRAAR